MSSSPTVLVRAVWARSVPPFVSEGIPCLFFNADCAIGSFRFFHKFCSWFVRNYHDRYIKAPKNKRELRALEETYRRCGFPGCVGSIDVVHIPWDRCPAGKRSWFKGKEGFPTLAYEVVVDHKRRIQHVTPSHPGAHNDKTIVQFDAFVSQIRTQSLFTDFPFEVRGIFSCCPMS